MTARAVKFEGRELAGAELSIGGAGAELDGDGDHHRVGTYVYLVIEAVIDKVTHRPLKDSDKLIRVEHGRALMGSLVDKDSVYATINAAREAADERAGRLRLDLD